MNINIVFILISSLSFFAYAISYSVSPEMKQEFIRFGLEKIGLLTTLLQVLGATGLLVGLKFKLILSISSLGLALMMLVGLVVRFMIKDSLWVSIPAFFFMVLNACIFYVSIKKSA